MRACPGCGLEIGRDFAFCPHCSNRPLERYERKENLVMAARVRGRLAAVHAEAR
jgi:hypothetical protein